MGNSRSRPLAVAVRVWTAVQVELQGWYTLTRFDSVIKFIETSSVFHDLVTIVAAPLPCLAVVVAMDMLPVNSPALGVAHQTVWVFFRVAFSGWIMAYMIILQVHQSSPTLPLSSASLWGISLADGACCVVVFTGLGFLIGFPTPFVVQMMTPPWFTILTTGLFISWRRTLRTDNIARENLRRYLFVFVAQVWIILVYTLYNITFTSVTKGYQPLISIILPALKLFFKNVVHIGVFHMEDLAPSVIVFNVDVFHAMFVSSTMQQAKTSGSVSIIMAVDVIQAIVAITEVHLLINRIHRNAVRCSRLSAATGIGPSNDSEVLGFLGVVKYAQYLMETFPSIRGHSRLNIPRHLRGVKRNSRSDARRAMKVATVVRSASSRLQSTGQEDGHPSSLEQLRVSIVRDVLKLLHMAEFYVLVEYAEVVVAAVYSSYMFAMSHLPNRIYYKSLAPLTHDQMAATVSRVAVYASLELLTFVVFSLALDRVLRFSTLRQLAFVLRFHARMVQTTLIMWVFFVPQLTFEHFGTDYSFQFKWLKTGPHE